MDEMQSTIKCPGCGLDLQLTPAQPAAPAEGDVTSEQAATMPLDELRSKLPKKSEE